MANVVLILEMRTGFTDSAYSTDCVIETLGVFSSIEKVKKYLGVASGVVNASAFDGDWIWFVAYKVIVDDPDAAFTKEEITDFDKLYIFDNKGQGIQMQPIKGYK